MTNIVSQVDFVNCYFSGIVRDGVLKKPRMEIRIKMKILETSLNGYGGDTAFYI